MEYNPFIKSQPATLNELEKALFGADLVTCPVDFRGVESLVLHRVAGPGYPTRMAR